MKNTCLGAWSILILSLHHIEPVPFLPNAEAWVWMGGIGFAVLLATLWTQTQRNWPRLCSPLLQVARSSDMDTQEMNGCFSHSVDLLCVANWQGYFVRVNATWTKVLGYTPQELCERPFLEFVHPDDRDKTLAEFHLLKSGQPTVNFVNRYRHQLGHYVWLAWQAQIVAPEEAIHAIAWDITAQRERQHKFFNALPDLIFHVDAHQRILDYKPARNMTTYRSPDDFLGRCLADILPPAAGRILQAAVERTLTSQDIQIVEYQLPLPEGLKDYEARLVPYGQQEILAVIRDITSNKQVWRERLQIQNHLQIRLRQQAAVTELGQLALATPGLEPLMSQTSMALTEILDIDYVQILELLPNEQAFLLRSGSGWQPGLVGQAVIGAGPHSLAGYTLSLGQPVIVLDLRTETRFSGTPLLHNHRIVASASVLIPRRDASAPYGVLAVHTREERTFTQHDVNFLQSVAHVLAAAIARQAADEELTVLKRVIENSKNGIILTDPNQSNNPIVYANPAFEAITGYETAEILGRNCRFLQGTQNLSDTPERRKIRDAIEEARDCSVVILNYRKDGTPFWNDLYIAPIVNDQGHLTHFVGIQNDITQRYQAELALKSSEEKYRRIVETAAEGIWILDQSGRTNFVNRQMANMLSYEPAEMIGKTFLDFMEEETQAAACRRLTSVQPAQEEHYDWCFRRQDGSILWAQLTISPLVDDDQHYIGALAMVTDITERKQAEFQLERFAFYDVLTGLPNRVFLRDALRELLKPPTGHLPKLFGVCFLDVDGFKIVNDGLGHVVGDQMLIAIAQRLQRCLRPQDLLARLGGDEFTILFRDLHSREDAIALTTAIHTAFLEPIRFQDYELVTGFSMGITFSDGSYHHPDELLRDADTAMYSAKAAGKGQTAIFDQQMREAVVKHLNVEHELRRAIAHQEFELYYQPIVCLSTGQLQGFEALLRWQHPERGLVSPGEFIPVAEDTGLILPIGAWVLQAAAQQLAQWQQDDALHLCPICEGRSRPLTLNVNLSARQFSQACLLEQIDKLLHTSGIIPHALKLEITESAVMENAKQAQKTLESLNERGLQLCIDDFGTGYSSLSYLRRFPVNTLKIDRSFICELETDREDAEITRAIVTLAHNLGMSVVAEGVERLDQIRYLQALQCEQGQGYYFSRPVPAAAATELIKTWPRFEILS